MCIIEHSYIYVKNIFQHSSLFFPVFPLTVFQYYGVILVYHSGLIPVYQSVVYHLVLILVYQSVVYHSGLILETARTPASHDRPWLHHLHKA